MSGHLGYLLWNILDMRKGKNLLELKKYRLTIVRVVKILT